MNPSMFSHQEPESSSALSADVREWKPVATKSNEGDGCGEEDRWSDLGDSSDDGDEEKPGALMNPSMFSHQEPESSSALSADVREWKPVATKSDEGDGCGEEDSWSDLDDSSDDGDEEKAAAAEAAPTMSSPAKKFPPRARRTAHSPASAPTAEMKPAGVTPSPSTTANEMSLEIVEGENAPFSFGAAAASDEDSDEMVSVPTSTETDWNTRFRLICKPEQSGKTAVMIRRILHEFADPPSGRTPINFIFCANSLLLTKQTGGRLLQEIEGLGTCVEFSSQKGALKKPDEVLSKILVYDVTNVVCPSNSCRVGKRAASENTYDCDGVIGIIDKLTESFDSKFTFNIWMDEADKFTKPLVKFRELLKRNINASVWCITATPEKLFEEFGNQNVLRLENTTSSNYHGWGDNRIKHFEPSTDCAAFVRQVLDKVGGAITSNASDDVSFDPQTIQGKLWEIIRREYVPGQTFTLLDVLRFGDEIGSLSKTVDATVRQKLQQLRDKELIQFITPGVYKRSPLVEGSRWQRLTKDVVFNMVGRPIRFNAGGKMNFSTIMTVAESGDSITISGEFAQFQNRLNISRKIDVQVGEQTSMYDAPSEIMSNTRWFIPGGTRKKSHLNIKDACVKRGFAVFVVNGDGISLTLPCGTEVPIEKKDDLLNSKIKKMYAAHNLHEHPVAITGNICVGRGISISDPEFMFTHGILSECKSGAEASQLAGRLKGNMKDWAGFQPPTVFTTHLFDETVSTHEEQSRRLGELAFEKADSDSDTATVTLEEFDRIGSSSGSPLPKRKKKQQHQGIAKEDKCHQIFDTQDKALPFIRNKWGGNPRRRKGEAPKEMKVEGNNPTVEYIITRWWGLSDKALYRMCPTINKKWVVYWKKE